MFVSFEVVRKCFESGAPSGCSPVEGCSSGFFSAKGILRLFKLQVATVLQAARISYVEQLMQHIAGGRREENVGLGCCWGGRGKSFAVALCRINFDICRV